MKKMEPVTKLGFILLVVTVILCVAAPFLLISSQKAWDEECAAKGGQASTSGRSSLCLTGDGRVLDHRY